MWLFKSQKPQYTRVPSTDSEKGSPRPRPSRGGGYAIISSIVVILLLGITAVFSLVPLVRKRLPEVKTQLCQNPRIRREWRYMSTLEKLDYIDAVKCLQRTPSQLQEGDFSHADDFPFAHVSIGVVDHEAATFLSWHRYFVHIYETALREQCQYTGAMPYWDWTLDYEDPATSPVFDDVTGFGGNGDINGPMSPVGEGFCVTDGPFAGLQVKYVGTNIEPHCLSRNFRNDSAPGHFTGHFLRPDIMDIVLNRDDFSRFVLDLEGAPHNTIPAGIRGDFLSFTAPADPIFFLHHGQVDHLWWKWQHSKPGRELKYEGKATKHSNRTASVNDILIMNGLAPDIKVSDILSTESGILCYTYDR